VDQLLEKAKAFAGEIAGKGPISIAFAKDYLQRSPGLDMDAALELETRAILTCMNSEDWKEGLTAFRERRKPRFPGR
jgi:enoyl-CoA hydratase/carnithine racemase